MHDITRSISDASVHETKKHGILSSSTTSECSLSYRTFSEDENVPFAETDYSYILENGKAEAINSTEKLSGKCYLVSLVAWPDKNKDVGVSCAIIYIKR